MSHLTRNRDVKYGKLAAIKATASRFTSVLTEINDSQRSARDAGQLNERLSLLTRLAAFQKVEVVEF